MGNKSSQPRSYASLIAVVIVQCSEVANGVVSGVAVHWVDMDVNVIHGEAPIPITSVVIAIEISFSAKYIIIITVARAY